MRCQCIGGELRTPAALADQQDFRGDVRQMGGWIGFELRARDAACAMGGAERAFVCVADIDQQRAGLLACEGFGGGAFVDGHPLIIRPSR